MRPEFPREVKVGMDGLDIYGHKRAMNRALQTGHLAELEKKPVRVRNHAGGDPGEGWLPLLHATQTTLQQPLSDVLDDRLYKALWASGAYDANAANQLVRFNMAHPQHKIVFPFPKNVQARECQGLHETGGLPANWALDWCAPPGSMVLAVEKATVVRLSGKAPSQDGPDSIGAFGWTTYYTTPSGVSWFWTHFGSRAPGLHVGQLLEPGTPIGFVGDQEFRPDHIHGGCRHPLGEAAAKKHVTLVNAAARITL